MRRTSGAGSWGLVLALAAGSRAGDDGPPPLDLPAEAPKPAAAPAPARTNPNPARRPAPAPSGVTTNLLRPRGAAPTAAKPAAPKPTAPVDAPPPLDGPPPIEMEPRSADGPPPLNGPSEMRALPDRPLGRQAPSRRRFADAPGETLPGDSPPPLTLEPEDDRPRPHVNAPRAADDDGRDDEKIEDKPSPGAPAPRRRLGIFSGGPAARPNPARTPNIRVEPRSDPAADAALKRRLETRVRDAVGDRARDIEVRVVDRNVVVRARVDRVWNRRAVRRTIETLPALSGYKARVEVHD